MNHNLIKNLEHLPLNIKEFHINVNFVETLYHLPEDHSIVLVMSFCERFLKRLEELGISQNLSFKEIHHLEKEKTTILLNYEAINQELKLSDTKNQKRKL